MASQQLALDRWEKELAEARARYAAAVAAPHVPGQIATEIQAVDDASERIQYAKFKIEWLQWCEESDEERWRHETNVQF